VGFILFQSSAVRRILARPRRLGVELFVILLLCAGIGLFTLAGRQMTQPFTERVEIDLSPWSLPFYTLLSLARGFLAYVLSLVFTLIYATIAAHNKPAERIMIPALDILQAVPVLGFLPGLVLAMVALFPTRAIGLEVACIIMIFTGQVWNMTFSYYASLKAIPQHLREAARVHAFTRWQTFKLLELPASMIGLVWNSMMSMAGGWFFLTVNEAFTLRNKDFRLPGIGSYMSQAVHEQNYTAMIMGIGAMLLMIVAVDRLFWRPIVVWSQRFKLEDTPDRDQADSFVLTMFQRSRFAGFLSKLFHQAHGWTLSLGRLASARQGQAALLDTRAGPLLGTSLLALRWLAILAVTLLGLWGLWSLISLLIQVPFYHGEHRHDWFHILWALGASFLRTTAAVALGALWALPVGILIGKSVKWSRRLQPVVQVVASFPAPMIFPLAVLALDVLHIPFTIGCVGLMLLGSQWYILFNVIAGASAIPADLKEAAAVNRLTPWQTWTRLYIPCVFPYLMTGLLTAAGGAWNATIVSEFVTVGADTRTAFGLGETISEATAAGNFPMLTAGIVTMALFVVLINRVVWHRLLRLSESRFSLNT
jgi:NitT/TauT family transport system permease protein